MQLIILHLDRLCYRYKSTASTMQQLCYWKVKAVLLFCYEFLLCRFKLLKETSVILGEHTEVAYVILQVGNTLNTETECIA